MPVPMRLWTTITASLAAMHLLFQTSLNTANAQPALDGEGECYGLQHVRGTSRWVATSRFSCYLVEWNDGELANLFPHSLQYIGHDATRYYAERTRFITQLEVLLNGLTIIVHAIILSARRNYEMRWLTFLAGCRQRYTRRATRGLPNIQVRCALQPQSVTSAAKRAYAT